MVERTGENMNDDAWITTFTQKHFYPLNPRPEDVDIRDIAHALANMCRFTGHTLEFYSVAQHSVLVSQLVSPENAVWGLLHDAPEAYIQDIARPLKQQKVFSAYRDIENKIMDVILESFGLDKNEPKEVKKFDTLVARNEAKEFLMLNVGMYYVSLPDLGMKITPLLPKEAEQLFLNRWHQLRKEKGGGKYK